MIQLNDTYLSFGQAKKEYQYHFLVFMQQAHKSCLKEMQIQFQQTQHHEK